jgi:FkbM family methyltransferase
VQADSAYSPSVTLKGLVKRSPLAPLVRSGQVSSARRTLAKARLVQDPIRFVALESGRVGRVGEHRLVHLAGSVTVRHRSRDTDVLLEMLTAYRPPASIGLPTTGTVLDIGANIGLFALWALAQCPGCGIVSYEPDPANLPLLLRNRDRGAFGSRWAVQPVAVSNHSGDIRFASGGYADSRASKSGDVVVPVVDIFEQPRAEFMKIDIEGSEWDILRDPRLPSLPADIVVIEWHRHATDGTKGDASEAAELLIQAGYVIAASDFESGRDHGLIWAAKG